MKNDMFIMKRKALLVISLVSSIILAAQINDNNLLFSNTRTYWALTKSLCNPHWNMLQKGIYFDPNGLFDWYQITSENDTLSLGEGMDWNINIDHRSYKLHGDTIFIVEYEIDGCCADRPEPYDTIPETINAYKILYCSMQKLLLLELKKDSLSRWVEVTYPPCHELSIFEFTRK